MANSCRPLAQPWRRPGQNERKQETLRSQSLMPCIARPEALNLLFICAAVPVTEWSARESLAAEAGAMGDVDLRARGEDAPLALTLRVMSAPASFALPMVQRKPFKPAFLVRFTSS